MSERNEKRQQVIRELAEVTKGYPGEPKDIVAAWEGVIELNDSIENEKLRDYISHLKVTITLHMQLRHPYDLTKSVSWKRYQIGKVLQQQSEHDRLQVITYLESRRYEYTPPAVQVKKSLFSRKPPQPQVQTYRLKWENDYGDFTVIRIA